MFKLKAILLAAIVFLCYGQKCFGMDALYVEGGTPPTFRTARATYTQGYVPPSGEAVPRPLYPPPKTHADFSVTKPPSQSPVIAHRDSTTPPPGGSDTVVQSSVLRVIARESGQQLSAIPIKIVDSVAHRHTASSTDSTTHESYQELHEIEGEFPREALQAGTFFLPQLPPPRTTQMYAEPGPKPMAPIMAVPAGSFPRSAYGKVYSLFITKPGVEPAKYIIASASGVMVGPNAVLACGHSVLLSESDRKKYRNYNEHAEPGIQFFPGLDGSNVYFAAKVVDPKLHDRWKAEERNNAYDFALLFLDDVGLGTRTGYIPIQMLRVPRSTTINVSIRGYPRGGSNKAYQAEGAAVITDQVIQYDADTSEGHSGSCIVPYGQVMYNADTSEGHSGGPSILPYPRGQEDIPQTRPICIGVHTGLVGDIAEGVYITPEKFANILQWFDEEAATQAAAAGGGSAAAAEVSVAAVAAVVAGGGASAVAGGASVSAAISGIRVPQHAVETIGQTLLADDVAADTPSPSAHSVSSAAGNATPRIPQHAVVEAIARQMPLPGGIATTIDRRLEDASLLSVHPAPIRLPESIPAGQYTSLLWPHPSTTNSTFHIHTASFPSVQYLLPLWPQSPLCCFCSLSPFSSPFLLTPHMLLPWPPPPIFGHFTFF